jgi:hypothetical protein
MKACEPWGGRPQHYQSQAQASMLAEGWTVMPWSWIIPTCGTEDCLTAEHLRANYPRRIEYPSGVCVYCGVAANTKDHLLPESWSGKAKRRWIATVPACGQCNSAINDTPEFSISKRREVAKEVIARRYRKVIDLPDYTPQQLAEYGKNLRAYIRKGLAERDEALRRLRWPEDPHYDIRAFHQTGIFEPAEMGLL